MGSGVSRFPNSSFSGQLPQEETFYTAQENTFCLLAPFSLTLSGCELVHIIELKDRRVTSGGQQEASERLEHHLI